MPGKSKKRQALEREAREAISEEIALEKGKYLRAFDRRAHGYAMLGHTNAEIAELIGVSEATFQQWIVDQPSLARSLVRAREDDHVRLVRSLHRAGNGFRTKEDKLIVVGGKVEKYSVTKVYPPSVPAITLALTNRHAERWRDKGQGDGGNTLNLSLILERAGLGDNAKPVNGELIEAKPVRSED